MRCLLLRIALGSLVPFLVFYGCDLGVLLGSLFRSSVGLPSIARDLFAVFALLASHRWPMSLCRCAAGLVVKYDSTVEIHFWKYSLPSICTVSDAVGVCIQQLCPIAESHVVPI